MHIIVDDERMANQASSYNRGHRIGTLAVICVKT
jgi:hypothetical protein